jgi:hypothetical protein
MSMMRVGLLFPQLAEGETRTAIILEPSARNGYLPADEYGMDELYCTERRCDCRRVMINVLARRARRHVATINHAFEPPAQGDPVPEQTFLDPLNKQSELAPALLELFQNTVLADPEYRRRLVRHYHLFKRVVDDPTHPDHRLLKLGSESEVELELERSARRREGRRPLPPPPRRGRKKWG